MKYRQKILPNSMIQKSRTKKPLIMVIMSRKQKKVLV